MPTDQTNGRLLSISLLILSQHQSFPIMNQSLPALPLTVIVPVNVLAPLKFQ